MKCAIATLKMLMLFSASFVLFSCNGQQPASSEQKQAQAAPLKLGETVKALGKNIDCIFQDSQDNYWFATNGDGVYRYDGQTLVHLAEKDGLCNNSVWGIEEDAKGILWLTTGNGVCTFNGKVFTNYTESIENAPYDTLKYVDGGLFFNHLDGICFYDGKSFTNFTIHPSIYVPDKGSAYRPYGMYSTLVDKSHKIWFGTQEKGVCVYDGKEYAFIGGKDLDGPAVRSIFQDSKGIHWFGNNGGGFYRYDGKTLRNITEERKLGNEEFLRGRKMVDKAGSLARVFDINEDQSGNIWIGTVDAGVWKYDGENLTNYTTEDGLSGNAVSVIYKDRAGVLWFVANGETVHHFDGQKFVKVDFQLFEGK